MSDYHSGEFDFTHTPMQSVPFGIAKLTFLRGPDGDPVEITVPVRVSVFVDLAHGVFDKVIRTFNQEELQYSFTCRDVAEEDYIRLKSVIEFKRHGLVVCTSPAEDDFGDRMFRLMTEPLSDDSMLSGPGAFAMTLNSVATLLSSGYNMAMWSNPSGGMPEMIKSLEQRADEIRDLLRDMRVIERSNDGKAAEAAETPADPSEG